MALHARLMMSFKKHDAYYYLADTLQQKNSLQNSHISSLHYALSYL